MKAPADREACTSTAFFGSRELLNGYVFAGREAFVERAGLCDLTRLVPERQDRGAWISPLKVRVPLPGPCLDAHALQDRGRYFSAVGVESALSDHIVANDAAARPGEL